MAVLCCAYWILALLGTVDHDSIEIDFESDLDHDPAVVGGVGRGMFASFLKFVNATEIPLTIIVTFISLCMWLTTMVAFYVLNPEVAWWKALGVWVLCFVVSSIITAVVTRPLTPIFKALKRGEDDEEPIVGCEGEVVTAHLTNEFGQVRVFRARGAAALINCKLIESKEDLSKGDRVIVTRRDHERGVYLVKPI